MKWISGGVVLMLLAVLSFGQGLPDIPIPDDFYDGGARKAQIDAVELAIVAQADTNATTTVTLYTPRRVGDTLIGALGGTNAVWVARGATTNDWSIIALPAGKFNAAQLDETDDYTFDDLELTGDATIGGLTASKPIFTDSNKKLVSTGTLAVGQGGTGATTLTGLVKGNGTSAMSAAAAGTDYLAPNAVVVTNVIVGVGDVTNTIVVTGGQIISWTVEE